MAYQPFAPQLGCKYVLLGTDGVTRAVFNDSTDADYVGVLSEITGLDSAEVRESADDLPQADGGWHGQFWYGRRPITMTIQVANVSSNVDRDTKLDKLRRASNALRADATLQWQNNPTTSNPGMQTWVRRQQPLRITGGWVKTIQLALVSQYAPLFSQTAHASAGTASGTPVIVENVGDYASYPVVRVAGPSTNPQVAVTGGGTLKTTGLTIASGHYVDFDCLNHSAVDDTGVSMNRYIDYANITLWPSLAKGNNTFTLTGGGTMTVFWRDAWS